MWLSRHGLLKSSRLIDAIKLRTNTIPTRATMKRAHENMDSTCRACGEADETQGHIIGQCATTKAKRIHRHNEIVDLLKNRLATNNRVMAEPTIELNGERYKLDLVILNETRALVLDVTVRYENKDYLTIAAKEKEDKYRDIAYKLKQDLKVESTRVVPIVVGSRGAIPQRTISEFKMLGVKKKDWLTISMIALRSSIEIVNTFMDS